MREGEQKDLKREMSSEKSEAKDRKYNIAKKIVSHKGSDEKYLKQDGVDTCVTCGGKHKTKDHKTKTSRRDGSIEDKEM